MHLRFEQNKIDKTSNFRYCSSMSHGEIKFAQNHFFSIENIQYLYS